MTILSRIVTPGRRSDDVCDTAQGLKKLTK
ncbi:hypothetical protein V1294_001626 [Bradyrhizobium sp. AZCC 1678]|uniref:Uncharacterized protein n=1 Tax=Bradyrhizobium algeriense TaxID=634784 RepID=A0ABU8B2D6_9BRAD